MATFDLKLLQQRTQPIVSAPRQLHLRTTLVLPFVIQIAAAVGLVGWLSFRSGQQAVNDLATQLRSEVTARVSDRVHTYVEIPQLVNQVNVQAIDLGILDFQNIEAARPYFWKQAQTYTGIGYVGFANEAGQYVRVGWINRLDKTERPQVAEQLNVGKGNLNFYHIDDNGNPTDLVKSLPNYDVRQRPFYEVAVQQGKPAWSEIFINFGNPILQINASTPYYDKSGQPLGILTSQMGLTQVSNFLQTLAIGRSGQVFIIEPTGKLVATSLRNQPLWVTAAGEKLKRVTARESKNSLIQSSTNFLYDRFGDLNKIRQSYHLEFMLDQQRQFLQVAPFTDKYGLNWLIVVVVPESDFMEQINANTRTTALLCLAALLAAIASGMLTARWITHPIQRIAQASEEIAKGDLDQRVENSAIVEIDRLADSFNSMAVQLQQSFEDLENRVEQRTAELRKEKERSELLLLNILPDKVAEQLKDSQEAPAEHFEEATILFADIVGFTSLAAQMEPLELVNWLNHIFSTFDQLAAKHKLEKIKTIGDAYMVVGGVPIPQSNHAEAVADMALAIQASMATFPPKADKPLQVRIGIHTGPVIAGVIGTRKFIYDLWGDAVNIASRMESHGDPGSIQVTDATYERLKHRYVFEKRGTIAVKGRGEMTTYWLLEKV